MFMVSFNNLPWLMVSVPFGHYVIPRLEIFSSFLLHFLQGTNFFSESSRRYTIEPSRVREQLIYFGVAGQILQNCEEYFIPYLSRKFFSEAKRITHMRDDTLLAKTKEEELVYLEKVRSDMDLPEYEIYEDYAEMAIQVTLPTLLFISNVSLAMYRSGQLCGHFFLWRAWLTTGLKFGQMQQKSAPANVVRYHTGQTRLVRGLTISPFSHGSVH